MTRKFSAVLSLILILSFVMAACTPATPTAAPEPTEARPENEELVLDDRPAQTERELVLVESGRESVVTGVDGERPIPEAVIGGSLGGVVAGSGGARHQPAAELAP